MQQFDLKEDFSILKELGFNYAVVMYSLDENIILHIVGYPEIPSNFDLSELIKELSIDEELELTNLIFGKDYNFIIMETYDATI